MQKQWKIQSDEKEYTIVYQGSKLSGDVKMTIDGVYYEYVPTLVKGVGLLVKLDIPGNNVILHKSLKGKELKLSVDGIYVDDQTPVASEISLDNASDLTNSNMQLQKKVKAGFGSFLTFVILSFANLALLVLNVNVSFPFSAAVPQILVVIGKMLYIQGDMIALYAIFIGLALIVSGIYLLLYFLSKKHIVPLYITLALIIIDTLILVLFSIGDMVSSAIDIAFHIWVMWSMVNLIKSKLKLKSLTQTEFLSGNASDA